ncbi:MAG: LysM peptidoglycan-binding domain-containing protein [Beijerinckiaceae bacterium]|nr:LysM peptidoglycan-binding domain-containing protein [Beijerinckiaceae bacterium]
MFTLSKRWAIGSGLVIVAAAVTVQIAVPRLHGSSPLADALNAVALLAPSSAPSAAVTPAPMAALPPTPVPHFDVVRVEPDGSAVVAGQGRPDSSVALLASGKVIGEAKADASGHFAFVPPALPPGGTALTLRETSGGVSVDSRQSVAVSVPEKGKDKGGLVVALAEPGQATKLLTAPRPARSSEAAAVTEQAPPGPSASEPGKPTPGPASALAIRSVELENGNGFFASGLAPPGTKLGVYLNNTHLADVVSGADSGWTVKLRQGLTPGHYNIRADALEAGKSVASRAEVPFDVPAGAPGSPEIPPLGTASTRTPADAVVAEVKTAIVRGGDNLWDISRAQLGKGWRYTRIYAANSEQIRNPNVIYPGQVFVMPREGREGE